MSNEALGTIWSSVGGDPALLGAATILGDTAILPSVYDVTGFAAASIAAATLAAAELLAMRTDDDLRVVQVDRRAASAAFVSEGLFTPIGWDRPPTWDELSGNYQTTDGWIRLHTNYATHRAAVERVLGAADRDTVTNRVRAWDGARLEQAIVDAGGCSAVMHGLATWRAMEAGRYATAEPLVRLALSAGDASDREVPTPDRPFRGIRVLDLTRVIAGPVCTRFLAAYGADVLRIDPPGFAEVGALLPETTAGKRTAALDLKRSEDREVFEELLRTADVLVVGLRSDAMDRLGYSVADVRERNPSVIHATLDAYGWAGPWRSRRGFDSLVQLSCGIAAAGASALGRSEPTALPAQALDHGTGYVLAAAVGRALSCRANGEGGSDVRTSLVATANLLMQLPAIAGAEDRRPTPDDFSTVPVTTFWGPARRVPLPGSIAGVASNWATRAGPLGRDRPCWSA